MSIRSVGGDEHLTLDAAACVVVGTEVAVDDGSLSEWTADKGHPVEVG